MSWVKPAIPYAQPTPDAVAKDGLIRAEATALIESSWRGTCDRDHVEGALLRAYEEGRAHGEKECAQLRLKLAAATCDALQAAHARADALQAKLDLICKPFVEPEGPDPEPFI